MQSVSSLKSVDLLDKFFELFKKKYEIAMLDMCWIVELKHMLFSLSNCRHKNCINCPNIYI
jgi:hypothetical protein